jgi:hypothetical protein
MRVRMGEFNVDDFVATMERLGLILAAVPLADGKVRLNRWRMPVATTNAREIENLWTTQLGDWPDRIEQVTAYVMQRTSEHSVAIAHTRASTT